MTGWLDTHAHYVTLYLSDPEFDCLLAELDGQRSVVLLHPTSPAQALAQAPALGAANLTLAGDSAASSLFPRLALTG